jgi:urease accessory protein
LRTTGRVEAAFAAAAADGEASWDELDAELAARTPSQAQRAASRAQGRGLMRTARGAWPAPHLDDGPDAPLWPIALGAAARAAGLTPADAALAAATGSITGPAWAATRLLGLNPLDVASALARLAPAVEEAAATRGRPAYGAPLLEVGAEAHARWEVRLFAS